MKLLQRYNPTSKPGCTKVDCLACKQGRGKGGNCHRANVNYKIECHLCPKERRYSYVGETSRNLYTRAAEHMNDCEKEGSFMKKHMNEHHEGMEGKFVAQVTNSNQDCMTRQVREGVLIRKQAYCLNTKAEWFQPALYRVRSEIVKD